MRDESTVRGIKRIVIECQGKIARYEVIAGKNEGRVCCGEGKSSLPGIEYRVHRGAELIHSARQLRPISRKAQSVVGVIQLQSATAIRSKRADPAGRGDARPGGYQPIGSLGIGRNRCRRHGILAGSASRQNQRQPPPSSRCMPSSPTPDADSLSGAVPGTLNSCKASQAPPLLPRD